MLNFEEYKAVFNHLDLTEEQFNKIMGNPIKNYSEIEVLSIVDKETKEVFKFVPLRHGKWEAGIHIATCSVCKDDVWFPEDYLEDIDMITDLNMRFCPHCGAKMDG